ncbi:MAG: ABC transporter ATP-binding protein [Ignavibacteria bacterium]|nr:ABC transporter ATP-binding protein [Ignavibacteria bacterium]MBT8381866.1 ABC transporter ATP-binding protein [Ignavibacteria bacterium]MBT8393198.1 ABC transporter ATP-binding protein [Ignavibacteria bacterium]NNL21830.1 ABC transporter ATP-binding protein [Ignavibacteriaceae bacterium]
MNSIEVKNLTKTFGNFTAVNSISFDIKKGEIFGFLGANGAGKTTTIRMLCGILAPTSGDAIVGGYSIMKQSEKVKTKIGYMSQRFSLYNDLTVEENINFFSGVYDIHEEKLKERKKWVLSIANIEGKEKLLTGSLPGGIKQRLALGTAVIHQPEIVFLDEPTSGVDPISRRNFWELINLLADEGVTVLVTTHYLEEAEFCNNIIMIDKGKIIAEGNAKELKLQHIKNKIYELECENPVEVMELLKTSNFVGEISIFGNNLHLSVNEQFKDEEQINSFIKESSNYNVNKLDEITATLEDVFIHLLEKGNEVA